MAGKTPLSKLANLLWPYLAARLKPSAVVSAPTPGLTPPTLLYVRIVGTQLEMEWKPVPNSAWYEVYRNSVPSASGKELLLQTTGSHVQFPNAPSIGELVRVNPGFESGDITGWLTLASPSGGSISSTYKHSGGYSLRMSPPTTAVIGYRTSNYTCKPLATYTISVWVKIPTLSGGTGYARLYATYGPAFDEEGVVYADNLIAEQTAVTDWVHLSGSLTLQNTSSADVWIFLKLSVAASAGATIEVYIDDASIWGPAAINTKMLYAVCAVDSQGTPSLLSSWLEPTKLASAVGDPALDHLMIDYENKAVRSSNFVVGGSVGASVTPSGVEGNVLGGMTGEIKTVAHAVLPTGWLWCDGSAVSRSTYSNLFSYLCHLQGNPTLSIASPCVVSLTNHGLNVGDSFYLTTTGALPTNVSANTLYYVISAGFGANSFQFSATRGGAAINSSGSQSGTHSLYACPWGLGNGSTTFNVPDLRERALVGWGTDGDVPIGRTDGLAFGSRSPNHAHTGGVHGHPQNAGSGFTGEGNNGSVGAASSSGGQMFVHGGSGSETGNDVLTGAANGGQVATSSSGGSWAALRVMIKT